MHSEDRHDAAALLHQNGNRTTMVVGSARMPVVQIQPDKTTRGSHHDWVGALKAVFQDRLRVQSRIGYDISRAAHQ